MSSCPRTHRRGSAPGLKLRPLIASVAPVLLAVGPASAGGAAGPSGGCSVADFGAIPDNKTDNSEAFRRAAASGCGEVAVPPGTWMTGPFNLTSHTVLRLEPGSTISGSRDPALYPIVTQLPVDEAYRAPYMQNRQRQALVSAYSAVNITVTGSGTIDGNGWDWWRNVTDQNCGGRHPDGWKPDPASQPACLMQRPKAIPVYAQPPAWFRITLTQTAQLVEFVDCTDIALIGTPGQPPLILRNRHAPFGLSAPILHPTYWIPPNAAHWLRLAAFPFWTFHPIFTNGVTARHVHFLAPRDHGNTDGVDPDSCSDVHVSDVLIDVGDDAVSVKSGLHWKTKQKARCHALCNACLLSCLACACHVPAKDYLFERTTILYRNFAIGSAVAGGVRNITFRDSTIGDPLGSSPWAIKIKTDSQEGGLVDGAYFLNLTIGNITYCGSSSFVFTPPHSPKDYCHPAEVGAQMIDVGMGYVGAPTDPGTVTNVVFDGVRGIGPTGDMLFAKGLPDSPTGCPGCPEHIRNLTLRNIQLSQGTGVWDCTLVDGLSVDSVLPWSDAKSSCKK
eukprot:gene2222-491_t